MKTIFDGVYKGKKVFLTGHTGFKGSWMALWLLNMGAEVKGYALRPPSTPAHFDLLNLDMESVFSDIRNREELRSEIQSFQPDIVFHLAAQPIVSLSYQDPIETYETNVLGTAYLLEACRNINSIQAIVCITSDKCYENQEWAWGYRETDAMGGFDPYSASKGAAELVISSYRRCFYNVDKYKNEHNVLLASARAGNVIGGGDWAADRLVPDIMKATANGAKVDIRNPRATRPWQHVLEPLSGYLWLGAALLKGKTQCATSFNFGPKDAEVLTVEDVILKMKEYWADIQYTKTPDLSLFHEAGLLKLDISKAQSVLKWMPTWNYVSTLEHTTLWYKEYYLNNQKMSNKSLQDIKDYVEQAKNNQIIWA